MPRGLFVAARPAPAIQGKDAEPSLKRKRRPRGAAVKLGAVKRTRTSTPVKELAPQASASTNSAMTAALGAGPLREEERRLTNRFAADKRRFSAATKILF